MAQKLKPLLPLFLVCFPNTIKFFISDFDSSSCVHLKLFSLCKKSLFHVNYIKNIYSLKSNVGNYLVLIHSNQYGQMLPQQYAKTLKIYNIQTPFQNARFAHFSLENVSSTSIMTLIFLTTDHL